MRPDALAWVTHVYPFSPILAGATVLGGVRYLGDIGTIFRNPISRWLVLLQVPIALSVVFAVRPELSYNPFDRYIRMIVVVLCIPWLVQTISAVRNLILVIAMSIGFLALKFGVFGLLYSGDALVNGYGADLFDNNQLALAVAMVVPLCWLLRPLVQARIVRTVLVAMVLGAIVTVTMSNSRGSALALGLAFLLILRRSQRKVLVAFVIIVVSAGAIFAFRESFLARMATLEHYDQEASAASRLEFGKAALKMWADYPITGVGFGGANFIRLSPRYMDRHNDHVVHNTYLQILVDSGVLALLIYLCLLGGSIIWLGRSAKRLRAAGDPLEAIPAALQISLIVFAFGSTFYSFGAYDLPYMLLMAAACWYTISKSATEAPQAVDEPQKEGGVDFDTRPVIERQPV
jgi:probable O-glycosylation ligase (exosortase A-associated)